VRVRGRVCKSLSDFIKEVQFTECKSLSDFFNEVTE